MIIPLATNSQHFDLKVLRDTAYKYLSEDISTEIKDERTEIVTLSKFRDNLEDVQALKQSHVVSKHFFYVFLAAVSEEATLDVITESRGLNYTLVAVNKKGNFLVLSGTLDNFVSTIISLSNATINDDTLALMNELQNFFEQHNLGFMFSSVEKVRKGTLYILKDKK